MPERLAADKKQKIDGAHAELMTGLQERGAHLPEAEATRLREKLAAYIGKTNPESIDIPTLRDAIAEKINTSPQGRARWFQKAGLLHTLEDHESRHCRRLRCACENKDVRGETGKATAGGIVARAEADADLSLRCALPDRGRASLPW